MTAIQPLFSELEPMPKASADAPLVFLIRELEECQLQLPKYLPNERIVYYADTAYVPYGPRSDEEIRELTARAVDWLYRQGCKIAVVACNTASAFSLDHLREHYGEHFPIVGLVPALKPAVLQTRSKVVAVLATPATFRGQLIKDVVEKFAVPAGVKVMTLTSLELVPVSNRAGQQMGEACLKALKEVYSPPLSKVPTI